MRILLRTSLCRFIAALAILALHPHRAVLAQAPDDKTSKAEQGVISPTLLPVDFSGVTTDKCKDKQGGEVTLALIVDENGHPRDISFLNPLGDDLDRIALFVVDKDRFKPATRNGAPVAAWQAIKVKVHGCVATVIDPAGNTKRPLRLRSQPEQKLVAYSPPNSGSAPVAPPADSPDDSSQVYHVRPGISEPIAINQVQAVYSDKALAEKLQGVCLVSLVVDQHGLPQHAKVTRSLEPGLDQNALEAVSHYRFKPALRNGNEPVSVLITIEVNYRLQ